MYRVHLLDNQRNLIAVLDQVSSWRYSRRASEAAPFVVSIPRHWVEEMVPRKSALWAFLLPAFATAREWRDEWEREEPNKGAGAHVASFLQLWKGDRLVVTGRISNRNLTDGQVQLECHTEEILLESHVTPAQYSRVLDGLDIGDFARMMLQGWDTVRIKDKSQWNNAVEQVNVDTSTEPGLVILAKDGDGKYQEEGHITLRFKKSDFPDFAEWDRIRWLSDNGDPVRTTMQYRYGNDVMSLSAWSEEFEGGAPDTLGVVPAAFTEEILDVRINLYTDDTESPDFEGNPVGQTPAVFAVEVIARTAGKVTEGDIPTDTGVIVRNIEADHTTALSLLQSAVEQAGWEFMVHDGKLYLGEQLGEDRRDDFVLRNGTNMRVETLGDRDEEMVNILTAYGPGDGINRMQVILRDNPSFNAYGPYPKTKEFPGAVDLLDLTQQAQEWLDEHKVPINAFTVKATFPVDEEPDFGTGDTVRVVDPQSGLVVDVRIMGEERTFGPQGFSVRLDLGRPTKGIVQAVLKETGLDEPVTPTGLVPPVGIRALTASPGIRVLVNPYASSRAEGVEIHGSATAGFTPSTRTLLGKGPETRFYFNHLTRGIRWYFKARSYGGGQFSAFTQEVSAVSGVIGGGDLGERVVQEINLALGSVTEDILALESVARKHLQDKIIDREALTDDLQDELDDAGERLSQVEADLINAGEQLSDIEQDLLNAGERLDEAESRLQGVEGVVSEHSVSIQALEEEIVLKASQGELDSLAQRVTYNEGELSIHASEIAARVKQEVFDILEGRVTANEGELAIHADMIAARVTQAVFDVLEQRVAHNEGELVIHADLIAARVTQEVFDLLEERVTFNEGELVVHADLIAARVTQEVFDQLEGRVTFNEGELAVHANEIAARVTQEVFNILEGRVDIAEATLSIHTDEIAARVTKTEFEGLESEVGNLGEELEGVEGRVTQAEATLSIHSDEIASKVSQVEFDATKNRLAVAESQISQQAQDIELRVVAYRDGQPLSGARLAVGVQNGEGFIVLDADKVLVPGSIIAELIGARQILSEHLTTRAVLAEHIRAIDAALSTITAGDKALVDHRGLTVWGLSDETSTGLMMPFFPAKARKLKPISRVGDLTGLAWKGRVLPPGTHGVWASDGYFSGELLTILGLQNQVPDGTIVDLSSFGWRHDYELVVTPVEFTVNTPATGQMLIRSYGEMIGPNKFKVRCLAFAPGAALSIGGSTNGKLNQQGSTTSVVYPPQAANMTTIKVRGTLTMQSNFFGGDAEAAVEIADLNPDNSLAGDWRQIYRRTIGARSFDWNTETFETPAVSTGGKRVAARMRCTRAHGSGDNMRITTVTITGDQYFNIDGVPHNPASTSSGFRAAYVVKEAEV